MLFKKIKKILIAVLVLLAFTRFTCFEEPRVRLTILHINVTDEQTGEPVKDALVGLYDSQYKSACSLDTLLTNQNGYIEYVFVGETFGEGGAIILYAKTIPQLTNSSEMMEIKEGQENEISFQTRFLQPVFNITSAKSFDYLFIKSMDRALTRFDREQLGCGSIYDIKTTNDNVELYDTDENISFPFKGVFNKENYLYIEKKWEGMVFYDTLQIAVENEVYTVLIE